MRNIYAPVFAAAFGLGLAHLPSQAAAATSPVAWVSKQMGNDAAGCGAVASPCKTFQYAHDNVVVAGGTIIVRDAGGYGPLVINKSVSIVNEGGVPAGIFGAPGDAIVIQAGTGDKVLIKGLVIDGAGTGLNGVHVTAALSSLTVTDCTFEGFAGSGSGPTGNGVLVDHPAGHIYLAVTNSLFTRYGGAAISVNPQGSGSVAGFAKNIQAARGNYGFSIGASSTTGVVDMTIEDSVVFNNVHGVISSGAKSTVRINRVTSTQNSNDLLTISGGQLISLGTNLFATGTSPTSTSTLR